jgi:hypothetical protein
MEVTMLIEGKLKRAALLAAADICLRRKKNSPKRCARNLIELGMSANSGKLNKAEQNDLYEKLLVLFEQDDIPAARALFTSVFL